jgi:hypothetical protein
MPDTLADETEKVTVPTTVTLKPAAWYVYRGDTLAGHISRNAASLYDDLPNYLAQWLPYGHGFSSQHDTRDEAVAAVVAGRDAVLGAA